MVEMASLSAGGHLPVCLGVVIMEQKCGMTAVTCPSVVQQAYCWAENFWPLCSNTTAAERWCGE